MRFRDHPHLRMVRPVEKIARKRKTYCSNWYLVCHDAPLLYNGSLRNIGLQDSTNSVCFKNLYLSMKKTSSVYKESDMTDALKTIASMIHKIKKAQEHFAKGTSQHTLAKNRLKALRLATTLIKNLQKKG